MTTKTHATVEDLHALRDDDKAELVDGVVTFIESYRRQTRLGRGRNLRVSTLLCSHDEFRTSGQRQQRISCQSAAPVNRSARTPRFIQAGLAV